MKKAKKKTIELDTELLASLEVAMPGLTEPAQRVTIAAYDFLIARAARRKEQGKPEDPLLLPWTPDHEASPMVDFGGRPVAITRVLRGKEIFEALDQLKAFEADAERRLAAGEKPIALLIHALGAEGLKGIRARLAEAQISGAAQDRMLEIAARIEARLRDAVVTQALADESHRLESEPRPVRGSVRSKQGKVRG